MLKSFIKSMTIILGSMSVIAIITIWIIGLFVQEIPTSALEEFDSRTQLRDSLYLDQTTNYNFYFPNYIPSYFENQEYIEPTNYQLELSLQKNYGIVESYSTKYKKFTHNGYIILFHNRMISTNNPLDIIEEKLVIASSFDKKIDISIQDRYFDEGGIPSVFNDIGIVDKEVEDIFILHDIEVRYFMKNINGTSDKSQLSAFFKFDGGIYKIYLETSFITSGHLTDWCFHELSKIVEGIITE